MKAGNHRMKPAAIGARMHSGWGAIVAVSNLAGSFEVVERRRIAVTSIGSPGMSQPYHFAANLALPEAEKFIGNCFATSKNLALTAVRDIVSGLRARQYRVVGSACLLASGRPRPPLAKILASHAAIHAAEGEFFRDIFSNVCQELALSVTGFRERDLDASLHAAFGKAATKLKHQILTLGRSLGPPWTADQKTASLAAVLVLANGKY
jgi:hypothetical protein